MEKTIPRNLVFILDDLAAGGENVGARWHVENENGKKVPFGRGLSMYKLRRDDVKGEVRIVEAWDFPEPFFKVAPLFLGVLRIVGRFWGRGKKKE